MKKIKNDRGRSGPGGYRGVKLHLTGNTIRNLSDLSKVSGGCDTTSYTTDIRVPTSGPTGCSR